MSARPSDGSTLAPVLRRIAWLLPWPAFAVAFVHLALAAPVTAVSGLALVAVTSVWVALAALAGEVVLRDLIQPAASCEPRSVARGRLTAVGRVPTFRFFATLGWIPFVPIGMAALGFPGWLSASRWWSVALAGLAAAVVHALQASFALRSALRGAEHDPEASGDPAVLVGRDLVRSRVARRVQLSIGAPALVACMLFVDYNHAQDRAQSEREAMRWARSAIESALAVGAEGNDFDARFAVERRRLAAAPIPVELQRIGPIRERVDPSDPDPTALAARLAEASLAVGVIRELPSRPGQPVVAATATAAGDRFVATVARRTVDGLRGADALQVVMLELMLLGIGVGLGFAQRRDLEAIFEDFGRAAERVLAEEAPTEPPPFAVDAEVAALHDVLGLAEHRLRASRVIQSEAFERLEARAQATLEVVASIHESQSTQQRRLDLAREYLGAIGGRVREVSGAAGLLHEAVDDSGSSIAELGAAGSELQETASVLSTKVDEVSGSMEQMGSSVKRVSATTEKLSNASDETSSSMEEMASAMRMVDTSAETMANLSRDVVAKAELGQEKVCQTIEGMEAIRDATDAAERVIRGLNARTAEIGGILDVIDDVADETNLLALNAAIIAAQAGEQGKAFSVVADEIKELADRVLASTKEIGGLIRSVQEESSNAIGAIEAGSQSVVRGVDLSAEAGRTLEEITVASRESGMRIGEIVASVREQTAAAGHVVELMERVRESSDEIAEASSEQDRGNEIVYRSAVTMREVAQQVRRTTEDQALGFGRIRDSVEGVRAAVDQINGSVKAQAGECSEADRCLAELIQDAQVQGEASERLVNALHEMVSVTNRTRDELARLRSSADGRGQGVPAGE